MSETFRILFMNSNNKLKKSAITIALATLLFRHQIYPIIYLT